MQPQEGCLMTRGNIREQSGREEVQTGDPDSGGGRVRLQHGQPAHGQSSQTLEEGVCAFSTVSRLTGSHC